MQDFQDYYSPQRHRDLLYFKQITLWTQWFGRIISVEPVYLTSSLASSITFRIEGCKVFYHKIRQHVEALSLFHA
jgi:hypothetical protein